jgi:hypothetical protein
MRVGVTAIPSSDQNCRHHVFVDDGASLKKLDLPSTTSVAVSQRFAARAGDALSYDCAVLLYSKRGFDVDRPAVRAVVSNVKVESSVSLMERSYDGFRVEDRGRVSVRFRESESFTVPTAGLYELRFITFVDRNYPGSEAHLFVNSVRIQNPVGNEIQRMATLSCVGRVRRPANRCRNSVFPAGNWASDGVR